MSAHPEQDMLSWLRSQILARKAAAEDLDGAAWGFLDYVTERPDGGGDERVMLFDVAEDAELFSITIGATAANEDHVQHMALNDPRDTIARCEAELATLSLHKPRMATLRTSPFDGSTTVDCDLDGDDSPCRSVRLQAYAYRHCPGWLPEWAPEASC